MRTRRTRAPSVAVSCLSPTFRGVKTFCGVKPSGGLHVHREREREKGARQVTETDTGRYYHLIFVSCGTRQVPGQTQLYIVRKCVRQDDEQACKQAHRVCTAR